MSRLVSRIDELVQEYSLLKHPFYQMWTDGKLTQESLAGYSMEYFQLVKAVPGFMTGIIEAYDSDRSELLANQQEEADHIEPWVRFAVSLGVDADRLRDYEGLEKTRRAVSEMSGLMTTLEGGACAMYAFEKEIPEISQTKLDGLKEFYGIDGEQATEYFKLHTEADVRHAASWRGMLESMPDSPENIESARRSLYAQNLLLDGCYESYCAST